MYVYYYVKLSLCILWDKMYRKYKYNIDRIILKDLIVFSTIKN